MEPAVALAAPGIGHTGAVAAVLEVNWTTADDTLAARE
jgi:hypothetical protein